MKDRSSRSVRAPLDFPNPLDLIVDMIKWRMRAFGTTVITGVILIAGLAIGSIAFFAPFVLAGFAIALFGLAEEPNKWLGTVLIVVSFVVGVIAVPLVLRHVLRRSRRVIALTEFADDEPVEIVEPGPSPIVAAASAPSQTRAAEILELDAHLSKPSDAEPLRPPP